MADFEEEEEHDFAGHYSDYDNVGAHHVADDRGQWRAVDYQQAAHAFFGDSPHFGESWVARYLAQGYKLFSGHDNLCDKIESHFPDISTHSLLFFEREGVIRAQGILPQQHLAALRKSLDHVDFSAIHLSANQRPQGLTRGLPATLRPLHPADTVDLRGYCSPVEDSVQPDEARAWGHAHQLVARLQGPQVVERPLQVPDVALEDVKRALTGGQPVVVNLALGPVFFEVARDGLVPIPPEGDSHELGWQTMLLVGYLGNFYIAKNFWGTEWGDRGYCYIPKKVLRDCPAHFAALTWEKPSFDPMPSPPPSRVQAP